MNITGIEGLAEIVNKSLEYQHHFLFREETEAVIRNFTNAIAKELKHGRIVFIEGFGSFEMKEGAPVFKAHEDFLKRINIEPKKLVK